MVGEQVGQRGGLGHDVFAHCHAIIVLGHFVGGVIKLEVSAGEEDSLAVDCTLYAASIAIVVLARPPLVKRWT